MRLTKLIAYSTSSASSVSGSSGGSRNGSSTWRCHGIHTSGIVERTRSGPKPSGSTSSTSTVLFASITISVNGVSILSRRTRLPNTSS